jgi:hypothetical protein
LDSSVDVWKERAVLMLAVTVQVPVVGLYSSALLKKTLEPFPPPVTSTLPSASSVAL